MPVKVILNPPQDLKTFVQNDTLMNGSNKSVRFKSQFNSYHLFVCEWLKLHTIIFNMFKKNQERPDVLMNFFFWQILKNYMKYQTFKTCHQHKLNHIITTLAITFPNNVSFFCWVRTDVSPSNTASQNMIKHDDWNNQFLEAGNHAA